MELEKNCSLNFLDLKNQKTKDSLDVSIYRKPTATDVVIHTTSNQPYIIKIAAFHSMYVCI